MELLRRAAMPPDQRRARGAQAAAAAFLQRAAELTPAPAVRASRALEAAQARCARGRLGA
ncbi:hypothetical protein ACWD6L_30140 [Micromonospora profundi]|uniref:hypothetical protein n=1 Tax=Micromonospora TaxID=1873 RepID=UPI0006ADF7BB|nr:MULTISPECIES: hypothetical protein [Micromonospora]KOX04971.1 hypothetical protein ADK66_25485 [Micromonospora sp. NRRL B-16802]NJC12900.1 hypothetical protein [Micromonospora profundi]